MSNAHWRNAAWISPMLLASMGLPACESKTPTVATDNSTSNHAGEVTAVPGSLPPALSMSIHFTDVTHESGINFTTTAGRRPATEIVEVKGGGLALIDYDNDGRLDLFVPNGATLDSPDAGPGCKLFRNLGGMKFQDVTTQARLTFNRWGVGAAVGDANGDGFDDIFITCFGKNALLRNQGDGTFTEVTDEAGLGDESWGTGCAWSDLDSDGDLDLYVANFLHFDPAHPPAHTLFKDVEVFAGPMGLQPAADLLYENLGDGAFRNITEASGVGASQPQYGLNIAILDFNADGRPDIFVGNDSTPNFLYENLGGLKFRDVGMRSGAASNGEGAFQATMGIAIGDVNGDARPDIFSSNFSSDTNTLLVNLGRMLFEDRTTMFGLGAVSTPYLGWATAFYDFGHDGLEDLIVFNGHVYPHATRETMDSDYFQPPLVFERRGGRFERVTAEETGPWIDMPYCDRSAVFGDLDNDGDIDIIVGELNGPVRVLMNTSRGGPWLTIDLRDARTGTMNHRGIGSVVDVIEGERNQRRWVFSGGSFQSSSALTAHFGFPSDASTEPVVRITWPDGMMSELRVPKLRAAYVVTRDDDGATIHTK